MDKKLTCLEWSLNMRSDTTAKPHEAFHKAIRECTPCPDILFLVETVKGNDFEVEGYTFVVESDNPIGNSVRIAIRSALLERGEIQVLGTCGKIPDTTFDEAPHYAQADVLFNGRMLNLVATRVLISCGRSTAEEYQQRRKQFVILAQHLSTLDNPVVMGDFNHGRILGVEQAPTDRTAVLYRECIQVQGGYFYQSIRDTLHALGLALRTPEFNISCGPKFVDGKPSVIETMEWNHKIDHLIVNDDKLSIGFLVYNWSHLMRAVQEGATEAILRKKGFPDHAMLLAEIVVKGDEESEAQ